LGRIYGSCKKRVPSLDRDGNNYPSRGGSGTFKKYQKIFDILSVLMMQSGVTMASDKYVTFASGIKKFDLGYPVFKSPPIFYRFCESR
jgi:hypothetical protein